MLHTLNLMPWLEVYEHLVRYRMFREREHIVFHAQVFNLQQGPVTTSILN